MTKNQKEYQAKWRQDNKNWTKAYRKRYYQEHRDRIKTYLQNNKERIRVRVKQYNQEHKVQITAWRKQYDQDHKEEIKVYQEQWHQEHKEEIAALSKQYRQTGKGKDVHRKGEYKRRALKVSVRYENFSPDEVLERDGYICQLCGCKTRPDYKNPNHPLYPNLDHIMPLSKGGSHTRLNTQCLCRQCNIEKKDKIIDQLRMFG